jgi:hypothetical protein
VEQRIMAVLRDRQFPSFPELRQEALAALEQVNGKPFQKLPESRWDKLAAYLGSPHLTSDNNACENAIRPFVLGRKNWLFNKSPEGAESSCGMYSLIETARQNGLEPLEHLRALFERCPLAETDEDRENCSPGTFSPLNLTDTFV